jgi:hypothetical protein
MNSTYLVIGGIAVGVIAMAAAIAYGTANQVNYIPEDAEPALAAQQGVLAQNNAFSPALNKEQWHQDPFADKAAEVRAEWEKNNGQ